MSQVTDKYVDPIERAKANAIAEYSTKKISTVPTEIIDLPSAGRFYPKNHPLRSGKVEMRYMTAYDEDILTTPSYITNNVTIDKLIQELIVAPEFNYTELLNCDKDALVLAARILSYGKNYNVVIDTPSNKQIKATIDLSKIQLKQSLIPADEHGYCTYISKQYNIKFKFLTIQEQKDVQKTEKPGFEFLCKSIISINGETNTEKLREILRYEILNTDSRELRQYIIDNLPTMDLTQEFTDDQGGIFSAGFPIRPDFFYPDIKLS